MSGRYDQRTTTFSQEGRLLQVEYAVLAANQAGKGIGILGKNCVILAGEKKTSSKLLDQAKMPEKLFKIDDHISCVVAGLSSDANTLISRLRLQAQQYTYTYGVPIPVELMVSSLCDLKQEYTQFGGLRPFGVSFLFAGYDRHYGFQLYHTSPAGVYEGWRAKTIGSNGATEQEILKQEWKEDMSAQEVKELIAKVLVKTMDTTTPDPDKLEWATIEFDSEGKIQFRKLENPEVGELMNVAKAKEEAA